MSSFNPLGLTPSLTPPLLTALHLAPLLSATASLTHAYMEYITTCAFLDKPPITSRISRSILRNAVPSPPVAHNPSQSQDIENAETAQSLSEAKQLVIPAWFTAFFNRGIYSVIGFNSLTLATALANLCGGLPHEARRTRVWYACGVAAGLAHYAFVPLVGGSVRALVVMCAKNVRGERGEVEEKKSAEEWLGEWVGWHVVRMSTVDVVAWICMAVGAIGALCKRDGGEIM